MRDPDAAPVVARLQRHAGVSCAFATTTWPRNNDRRSYSTRKPTSGWYPLAQPSPDPSREHPPGAAGGTHIAGRRADEATGALLLKDVRAPSGQAGAGEHRGEHMCDGTSAKSRTMAAQNSTLVSRTRSGRRSRNSVRPPARAPGHFVPRALSSRRYGAAHGPAGPPRYTRCPKPIRRSPRSSTPTYPRASPVCRSPRSSRHAARAPPCRGRSWHPPHREIAAATSAPVDAMTREVNVGGRSSRARRRTPVASTAWTWAGSGSPRQRTMNRSTIVLALSISALRDHRLPGARARTAPRSSSPSPRHARGSRGRCRHRCRAGAKTPGQGQHGDGRLHVHPHVTGVHRDGERLGGRQAGVELVVDQQSPDVAERDPADQILDVHTAVPQRTALCPAQRSPSRRRQHLPDPVRTRSSAHSSA